MDTLVPAVAERQVCFQESPEHLKYFSHPCSFQSIILSTHSTPMSETITKSKDRIDGDSAMNIVESSSLQLSEPSAKRRPPMSVSSDEVNYLVFRYADFVILLKLLLLHAVSHGPVR